MDRTMVLTDPTQYQLKIKEGSVIVVALAWVLALGSVVLAALILCGWHGAKKVVFDWRHFRVWFYCR